jgi:hypothetical protein
VLQKPWDFIAEFLFHIVLVLQAAEIWITAATEMHNPAAMGK